MIWTDDLWASYNFQAMTVYQKGIFTLLTTRCRKTPYLGQFRFPNGNVMTPDEIIDQLLPQQGDRRDRIKEAMDEMLRNGMLFKNSEGAFEIRKFAEKAHKKAVTDKKLATSWQRKEEKGDNQLRSCPKTSTGDPTYTESETKSYSDTKEKEVRPPLDSDDRLALDLAQSHRVNCKEGKMEWAKDIFYSALKREVKAKDIEQMIIKNPGVESKSIVRMVEGDKNGTSNSGQGKVRGAENKSKKPGDYSRGVEYYNR